MYLKINLPSFNGNKVCSYDCVQHILQVQKWQPEETRRFVRKCRFVPPSWRCYSPPLYCTPFHTQWPYRLKKVNCNVSMFKVMKQPELVYLLIQVTVAVEPFQWEHSIIPFTGTTVTTAQKTLIQKCLRLNFSYYIHCCIDSWVIFSYKVIPIGMRNNFLHEKALLEVRSLKWEK